MLAVFWKDSNELAYRLAGAESSAKRATSVHRPRKEIT